MAEGEKDRVVVNVADAFDLAVDLHRHGRLGEAEAMYRAILELVPEEPRVRGLLGVVLHQLGRGEEGVVLAREAVEALPDWKDAWNNLGNILKELSRHAEAVEAYDRAIALDPEFVDAWSNRGVALKNAGRLAEAEASLRGAIARGPSHAEAYHNLGNVLERLERHGEAADAFAQALRLKPGRGPVWRHLANALASAGRLDEARKVLDEWLAFEPGDPTALHMRAAVLGADVPRRAADAYVRGLFDAIATQFDEKLAQLSYRAPEILAARIRPRLDTESSVLDAGAGTGLCGPLLKPPARRLVGVDLSGEMLRLAAGRGVYDRLDEAELGAWLATCEERFDVAVCADTLCYFGVLDEALSGFARVLNPGGVLAFTVERGEGEGYRLQRHGRYAHGEGYVRSSLERAGLTVASVETDTLRHEVGEPVVGLVVVGSAP